MKVDRYNMNKDYLGSIAFLGIAICVLGSALGFFLYGVGYCIARGVKSGLGL